MKIPKLIILGMVLFLANSLKAQVSVNVNVGSPPQWGPAGYSDVRYYYLPDVEAYYDVQSSRFIYYEGNTWVHRTYLPARYRNYDLYDGYKVVMTDYRGNAPYTHFKEYKHQYARGYRGHEQHNIGMKPQKNNAKYAKENYRGNQGDFQHNNGKNKDKGNGHGNEKNHGGKHK